MRSMTAKPSASSTGEAPCPSRHAGAVFSRFADDYPTEHRLRIHRRPIFSNRAGPARVLAPHSVRSAGRNDHHHPGLEDVLLPRDPASHGTLDNFDSLLLMRVYMVARRLRDFERDILASKELAGRFLRRLEDDHSISRYGALCDCRRHARSPSSIAL